MEIENQAIKMSFDFNDENCTFFMHVIRGVVHFGLRFSLGKRFLMIAIQISCSHLHALKLVEI